MNQQQKLMWGSLFHPRDMNGIDIFPDFKKQNFEDLKNDYNKQFGYTIRIPQVDDIVHVTPNFLKSPEQLKLEKKMNLTRVLDSPAPNWFRSYSTIMTWIDNIQDTQSVLYPLLKLGLKIAPKAFGKLLPIVGWIGAGYDILNLLNAIGRAPLGGMKAKRDICKFRKQNPFGFWARYERTKNIRNWKPNVADALQAAQVLDQFTGAGLSLGPMMGAIFDSIFGAYHYLAGDPVKFTFDPPSPSNLDLMGAKGLRAAANISSHGQIFSEEMHFWTYQTYMMSLLACGYNFEHDRLAENIIDPTNMLLPADKPTDPITIQVIQEAGLDVDSGVRWPYNEEKTILAGDLMDAQIEPIRANFISFCNRHQGDNYGLFAAAAIHWSIPATLQAIDPDGTLTMDDTDAMKTFYKMVKAPLLPTRFITPEETETFRLWATDYLRYYDGPPGIIAIENQLQNMGIPYKASYPAEPGQDFEKFWPEGYQGDSEL